MLVPKKPVAKKPATKTTKTPVVKTQNPDDFDNNPATIMRNGGKVKRNTKSLPKKSAGGKMRKSC